MRKIALAAVALSLLAAPATARTVSLDTSYGGFTVPFINEARTWLKQGTRVRLTGDQYSSAAIRAVWFRQQGGNICAEEDVMLYFHMGKNVRKVAGRRIERLVDVNRIYLGRSLRTGWYEPQEVGIRSCD